MPDRITLDVWDRDADTYEAAAERAAGILREAARRGRATVALCGGRSGRGLMVALAARNDLPWGDIDWAWVDERCVPADDPQSNVKLARDSLLGPRRIQAPRIHPPPTELGDPERVAAAYGDVLASLFGAGAPLAFDLVVLGLGDDGHIASLPPGSAALDARAPVAAVPASAMQTPPAVDRVTLTPPILAAARHVLVLACGKEKAAAVSAALREPPDPARRPAQLVAPSERVAWLLDQAAATDLLKDAQPAPQ